MKIVIAGLFYKRNKNCKTERTFPDLNNFLSASRSSNHYVGNAMKRKYQDIAVKAINEQVNHKITGKVFIHYDFYENDKRRDPSNISAFAIKVFEDALQECGIISNDNWDIEGFECHFHLDKENPRIEVTIDEEG